MAEGVAGDDVMGELLPSTGVGSFDLGVVGVC